MNYRVVVAYRGYDAYFDTRIEKTLRRAIGGSGYCLADGTRDLVFYYQTKQGAANAVKRVRAMTGKKKATSVRLTDNVGAIIR